MNLRLAKLELELLPNLAVWLPDHRTLLVSDLHLGKSATFRARGIPIPEGETRADLVRLQELVVRMEAARLLILGDLVHAAEGLGPGTVDQIHRFLDASSVPVTLIEGNHDRSAGLRRLDLPLEIQRTQEIDGVTLIHDPADLSQPTAAICGHLHPSVRLPQSPRRRTRLPCFHLSNQILALPGFGSFTGTHPIHRGPDDRVFVPLRDQVREVPAPKT
ncbi:ligase-associated DNA damage response endonuclease PdeM [Haloferula sp. A504]|uniref:ligase-associated DNA damage response endonuclease PdeM n=1 Tax=Haloferula sp. A504 TaxID=3373601 RepID=UPI0031C60F2E|nr:ligase-associated DNA damage response endonuclease PdeM [Verrucomicrobiaceae bacterium E54]